MASSSSAAAFQFAVEWLTVGQWVITAMSDDDEPSFLIGVYNRREAAEAAMDKASAGWLDLKQAKQARLAAQRKRFAVLTFPTEIRGRTLSNQPGADRR